MVIKEDNIIVKYALVDQGAELRGKEVELKLMWDHMPLTGGLFMAESTNTSKFTLPVEYK
jgi:signal peptidase complex subunit 3